MILEEFHKITAILNSHEIKVYLLGSLGAEIVLKTPLFPEDIDLQILKKNFDKFDEIIEMMKLLNYQIIDFSEHKFSNGKVKVGFGIIETLVSYAGIDVSKIPLQNNYYLPTLEQFIKIYEASSRDEWRKKHGKNNKDKRILHLLKEQYEQLE